MNQLMHDLPLTASWLLVSICLGALGAFIRKVSENIYVRSQDAIIDFKDFTVLRKFIFNEVSQRHTHF